MVSTTEIQKITVNGEEQFVVACGGPGTKKSGGLLHYAGAVTGGLGLAGAFVRMAEGSIGEGTDRMMNPAEGFRGGVCTAAVPSTSTIPPPSPPIPTPPPTAGEPCTAAL